MTTTVQTADHIKFRREADGGLVYDHENYGYEDASLYSVSETVIDVLEFVDGHRPRDEVESEFSPDIVEALLEREVLIDGG